MLAIDILFFNSVPFLLTVTWDIHHFYTIKKLTNQENKTLLDGLKQVVSIYNTQCLYIQYILADDKFRPMTGDIVYLQMPSQLHLSW